MAMASKTSPLPTRLANVSILLGDGAGNFSAATDFAAGDNPHSVAVGDFNGDGKQDLAVANGTSSDNVSILLRDCQTVKSLRGDDLQRPFRPTPLRPLAACNTIVTNDLSSGFVPVTSYTGWRSRRQPATTPSGCQTITTGNFNTFFTAIGNGSNVFDSNCVSLERAGSQIGDTVQVRFNAPSAGTYFIAINFNAQSLLGQPAPSPTTVHYDFTTTGVPDSTSGLDLLKH